MTEYRTMELDNGEFEVLRAKEGNPPSYEVIARFYDRDLAIAYANEYNLPKLRQLTEERLIANGANGAHHHNGDEAKDLSANQWLVLKTLRKHALNGIAKLNNAEIAIDSSVRKDSVLTALAGLQGKGKIDRHTGGVYRIL